MCVCVCVGGWDNLSWLMSLMYVHTNMYATVCTCVHACGCVCVCGWVCVCVCVCVWVGVCVCVCGWDNLSWLMSLMYVHTNMYATVCTCVHACVCVCVSMCLSVSIISFIKFALLGNNILLKVQPALYILWMLTLLLFLLVVFFYLRDLFNANSLLLVFAFFSNEEEIHWDGNWVFVAERTPEIRPRYSSNSCCWRTVDKWKLS